MEPQGRLDIVFGCMFSGKTSVIRSELSRFADIGLRGLYIRPQIDTRNFTTHSLLLSGENSKIDCLQLLSLNETAYDFNPYDIIGIDEAQFFDSGLIKFVLYLVEKLNKYVIIGGLDGSFERKKFGHILDLIPYADNVSKTHAYCERCVKKTGELRSALFTHRTVNDNSSEVLIGGSDQYQAVCRKCYLELH